MGAWQMAASQGCCVIISLSSPSPAGAACLALKHSIDNGIQLASIKHLSAFFNTHIKVLFITRQWLGRFLGTRQRSGVGGNLDRVWEGTSWKPTLGLEEGRGAPACAWRWPVVCNCGACRLPPPSSSLLLRAWTAVPPPPGLGSRWGGDGSFWSLCLILGALRRATCLWPALKPQGAKRGTALFLMD